ncbi:carbon monoxide dehydrogenase accessory protein; may be involved in the anchoring of CO dehydrogenase to the cytoplasmic membrane [Cupriavidus taiwanensis]|uniref:Carbon monoxide dehydrogenase accessory protein may be involved in the anchoring of CO dehydrogenase to the cytoplasmic membrane n=1 Tax=Cupriavidus taiwanensis TaxID=164546 RepID=A0A975X2T1_9BURK|nr:carbon monoxide dehydrogenase subunit G [Cupriavidus taiwanensis]SOY53724.1 carbon monoxide dehydrogenase accessory protein; may be involved in the anchoring of CO dehydrogenase to the cytoplasmic membrane [Cupriavidus taiwanensis]
MEMNQSQRLPVPQQVAWEALNDTELLKQCIPGCESIEPDGDHAYLLAMTAAVGPVKARFKGRMALEDIQAPDSYTIRFDGQGGAAGFGKGSARVRLEPDGDETVLTYTVNAQVGGKIAQIGSRLVDAAARKMADTFFARFTEAVSPDATDSTPAAEGAPAAAAGDHSDNEPTEQAKRKRSWTAWISKS